MLTDPNFRELLNLFNAFEVRYMVVGGYAVMKYTEPRFTKDLDLWISTEPSDAKAVYQSLKKFGAFGIGISLRAIALSAISPNGANHNYSPSERRGHRFAGGSNSALAGADAKITSLCRH